MSEKMIENNKVSVIGEVVSEFTFSHEVFGEGFYIADLAVSRLSDQVDVIPLMISERLLDVSKDYRGMTMEAIGQFRSYNRHEGAKNRLVLSVLSVRFISWKNLRITPKPTRFFWKAISARSQSTGKHRWDARLPICCWRSTVRMENQIISRASAGDGMRGMPLRLPWAATSHLGTDPEPGIYEAAERDGNGKADRI